MATNNADWIPGQQPPLRRKDARHTQRSFFFDPKPIDFNPRTFAIEIRDKNFNLKARVEPYVTSCRWEWNRIGGCGRATIKIQGDYTRVRIESDDDVQIWLPNENGTSASLWYRGYVETFSPSIQGSDEYINIECMGYFGWTERLIVHDSGAVKTFTNSDISTIVRSILQEFLTPVTNIQLGTIEFAGFAPDTISFKTTIRQVLDTLFDLLGTVEYGVNEHLNFYWYNQNDNVMQKFFLGDKITGVEDRRIFRDIINQIEFEGGTVDGAAFTTRGGSSDSVTRYGRHERILNNGSITTLAVASQFMAGILGQKAKPQLPLSVQITNTNKRIEQTVPIGAIAIIDPTTAQTAPIYGTTGNGGSNKIYGKVENGGSGQLYGGTRRDQVDRIQYIYEPEDGRVTATVQFGDTSDLSRAAATLKRIELSTETVRQRSL